MEERIAKLERDLNELRSEYYKENFQTSETIRKDLTIVGRLNINGNVGYFDTTPVGQQSAVSTVAVPSGVYVQAEANNAVTAINALIARLQAYGLLP